MHFGAFDIQKMKNATSLSLIFGVLNHLGTNSSLQTVRYKIVQNVEVSPTIDDVTSD